MLQIKVQRYDWFGVKRTKNLQSFVKLYLAPKSTDNGALPAF